MDQRASEFQAFERDGWNAVADAYGTLTDGLTGEVAGPLLDAAVVGSGSRVIDVASGPGWTAAAAMDRGASVIGVDISEAMVEQATRRYPAGDFRLGTAEALPIDDGSADAVVSAFGMPHFADHEAFAAEAHRVLRPGGRIAFASWRPPAENPFFGVALGSIAKAGDLSVELPQGADMFSWADQATSERLLADAGFEGYQRADVPLQVVTDDGPGTVVHFLENAAVRSRALFQAQTPEAKKAISATITEMMAPMEQDGTWTVPLNAFVVSAVKPA